MSAAVLGLGLGLCLLVGLSTVRLLPALRVDWPGVGVALFVSGGLTGLSLRLVGLSRLREGWSRTGMRLMAAATMGLAVSALFMLGLGSISLEVDVFTPSGLTTIEPFWLALIVLVGAMGVVAIISMAAIFDAHLASAARRQNQTLRQANDELARLANHDALTGLPNRVMLVRSIDQAIRRAQNGGRPFGLIFIDLDGFKAINDSLGHHVGDRLLCAGAERMANGLRRDDLLARLGGDEFVVLVSDIDNQGLAEDMAARMRSGFASSFGVIDHELKITATFGISLYPAHGASAHDLLISADTAMYRGKRQGRNQLRLFDPIGGPGAADTLLASVQADLPLHEVFNVPSPVNPVPTRSRSSKAAAAQLGLAYEEELATASGNGG